MAAHLARWYNPVGMVRVYMLVTDQPLEAPAQ